MLRLIRPKFDHVFVFTVSSEAVFTPDQIKHFKVSGTGIIKGIKEQTC